MKYKLVEFIDGTWGVLLHRPWWQGRGKDKFVDLISIRASWDTHSEYFPDCKGTKEKAQSILKRLTASTYRVVELDKEVAE